jgi:hypothetical protein
MESNDMDEPKSEDLDEWDMLLYGDSANKYVNLILFFYDKGCLHVIFRV